MRSFPLSLAAVSALLLQPIVVHALVRISAYAGVEFTVNFPSGTHQLIPAGGHYDFNTEADLSNTWTTKNGAVSCYVDAPSGIPDGVTVGFEMLQGSQFLYPCGWVSGVRVVCTPESECCSGEC